MAGPGNFIGLLEGLQPNYIKKVLTRPRWASVHLLLASSPCSMSRLFVLKVQPFHTLQKKPPPILLFIYFYFFYFIWSDPLWNHCNAQIWISRLAELLNHSKMAPLLSCWGFVSFHRIRYYYYYYYTINLAAELSQR